MIPRNPADLVELPRSERSEATVLSGAQLPAFLQAARDDRWSVLWMLLLVTGLRPGEALGLKWSDLEGERLLIQRTVVRRDGHAWEFAEPKTARSRRPVSLPISTVEALNQHRRIQLEERLKAGPKYANHNLIFASNNGQPLDWRRTVADHFRPLLKKADLPPIRPYDLRHTSATLLLTMGEHPKVVSERLGHSSITLTLDTYSHVLPDMQQASADKMESLFGPMLQEA
jgi:integrase